MSLEPDAQNVVLGKSNNPGEERGVAALHCVLSIRRNEDHIGAPMGVQRIHELFERVKNVSRGVEIKNWDSEQVQIGEDAGVEHSRTIVEE